MRLYIYKDSPSARWGLRPQAPKVNACKFGDKRNSVTDKHVLEWRLAQNCSKVSSSECENVHNPQLLLEAGNRRCRLLMMSFMLQLSVYVNVKTLPRLVLSTSDMIRCMVLILLHGLIVLLIWSHVK
ncbi:hypothetical protein J6590_105946 [Homalodisca vitripennis]|nr:hypothetical protein J6590_105946 [Homalodisca vitripennis]